MSNFDTKLLLVYFVGTFLGNCEADRERLKVRHTTVSLWSYLNGPEILQLYLNPMYDPNNKVIWPSVAPMSLVSILEYFIRTQDFPFLIHIY